MDLRENALERPDGATIAYRVRAGRRPWVLLHGLGCDASMWTGVVEALPRDLGLVVPDLRGHGGSTLGWRAPSLDLWAEDVAALIEAEGLSNPAVAGLSMGGYTALALAARGGVAVRAWGLVSTSAAPDDDAGRAKRAAAIETLDRRGWNSYLEGLLPLLLAPGREDAAANRAHLETMFARAGEVGLASALWALASRPDRRPLLPSLGSPAIVVVGDADVLTPPERAREIAAAAPRAECVILPGVGHMSALESPAEVAEALLRIEERA